jgi:hypothetical protein
MRHVQRSRADDAVHAKSRKLAGSLRHEIGLGRTVHNCWGNAGGAGGLGGSGPSEHCRAQGCRGFRCHFVGMRGKWREAGSQVSGGELLEGWSTRR